MARKYVTVDDGEPVESPNPNECPHCGRSVPWNGGFRCPHCGMRFERPKVRKGDVLADVETEPKGYKPDVDVRSQIWRR